MELISIFLIVPPVIVGALIGLLPWLFWFIQKLVGHKPSKLNIFPAIFIGLFSFSVSVILYTYALIEVNYVMTIPSSPIATEKQYYQDQAISEAFWRSILPPVFQEPCNNKPVLVCELGNNYSLNLWDTELTFNDLPILPGIISMLVSLAVTIYGHSIFQKRKIADIVHDRINALVSNSNENLVKITLLREKGDIERLIEIMRNNNDWMLCLDAAEALAQLGNEHGINYLVSSLESPDNDIRDVAKEILEGLPKQQSNPPSKLLRYT